MAGKTVVGTDRFLIYRLKLLSSRVDSKGTFRLVATIDGEEGAPQGRRIRTRTAYFLDTKDRCYTIKYYVPYMLVRKGLLGLGIFDQYDIAPNFVFDGPTQSSLGPIAEYLDPRSDWAKSWTKTFAHYQPNAGIPKTLFLMWGYEMNGEPLWCVQCPRERYYRAYFSETEEVLDDPYAILGVMDLKSTNLLKREFAPQTRGHV